MKPISQIITLLVLSLSFGACEKTIDFSGNSPEPLIVMNCILVPDSVIKVELTKTRFFLSKDNDFSQIEDATVSIRINDSEPQVIPHSADGVYVSTLVCAEGDRVRIDVTAPKLASVWAEEIVQHPISILSVDTTWSRITDPNIYISGNYVGNYNGGASNFIYNSTQDTIIGECIASEFTIRIEFQDPIDTKDYYRMNAFLRMRNLRQYFDTQREIYTDSMVVDEFDDYYSIDYVDPVFSNESENQTGFLDIGYYGIGNTFTDAIVNGKNYFLTLRVNRYRNVYYDAKDIPQDKDKKEKLILHFEHLSSSQYYYFKTVDAATMVNTFSEPVQIYTNIKGGLGILGSYTTEMDTIFFD